MGEYCKGVMVAIDGEPMVDGGWFFVPYLYSDSHDDITAAIRQDSILR